MPRFELYYLERKVAEIIDNKVKEFAQDESSVPEDLLSDLIAMLPIKRTDLSSVRRRVEGFYYTTEILWHEALRLNNGNRQEVVKLANLKPLSHYHYLTGSREPFGNVLTRADFLNDPATALVKLRDDINGLSKTFPIIRKRMSIN